MERWKEDFIAGLRSGKPAAAMARLCAGLPLAAEQAMREDDLEFSQAWDEAAPSELASSGRMSSRLLTPSTLEALLWAQTPDKGVAAYFGMDEPEFLTTVANDAALKKIYQTARDAGLAAIELRQYEEAMDGDRDLLKWLGKQHLNQAEKVESKHTVEDVTDTTDLARRMMLIFAQGGITPAIDGEVIVDALPAPEEAADES